MDDSISRKALLERLDNRTRTAYPNELYGLMLAHDYISDAPAVETGSKWIPVTERLPDRDGQYLCNYHFGEHRGMTFTRVLDYFATDKVPHFQHTLGDTTMKVTHWMPLPTPPKGECE